MGKSAVLKMDPQIVHHGVTRKGSKTRQNDEVWGQFLLDFQQNLAKTVNFKGLRAYICKKRSKNSHF